MGSIVEQYRSHLAEQAGYAGERCRIADKTRSKSSTRQAGRNDVSHIVDEETQKCQNYWTRNWQLRDCQCSTMERTNRWWVMFTASWTKRLISPQPF